VWERGRLGVFSGEHYLLLVWIKNTPPTECLETGVGRFLCISCLGSNIYHWRQRVKEGREGVHPLCPISIWCNHLHLESKSDGLNDLKDGRSTDDKDKKGQHPRADGILFIGILGGLGNISSKGYILRGLFIGYLHLLTLHHGWRCWLCWLFLTSGLRE